MKKTNYKQCTMEKKTAKGFSKHTAWIPTKFAKVGKYIQIDGHGDGWQVTTAGTVETNQEQADKASQMHKKTRKASDI